MPKTKKVGKDASTRSEEAYYQTLQDLLRQKEQVDRQIFKVQGKLFRCFVGNSKTAGTKRYVPRMHNTVILRDAIRKSMVPGKKMTMQDVLSSIRKQDLYHTNSRLFYTMVNNKLNRDKKIQKTSRGVFVLQKSGQRKSRKVPASAA